MATPTCFPRQDPQSCRDSALSVTGNVIGILTFAGAVLISVQVYINSIRNAEGNLKEATETFRSRVEDVRSLQDKLRSFQRKWKA